jgi:hypothetical protein
LLWFCSSWLTRVCFSSCCLSSSTWHSMAEGRGRICVRSHRMRKQINM